MHSLEFRSERVRSSVRKFYDLRTRKDRVVPINTAPGYGYYASNEVYKEDKWLEPYIGRWYPEGSDGVRATEVVTMFFSYLYEGRIGEIIDKDPEWFAMIYELLGN